MKALTFVCLALVIFAGSAFADYGYDTSNTYAWADGDEVFMPEYAWVDASSGTDLGIGDDSYFTTTTPFDIDFYGNSYSSGTSFYVGTNGMMGFSSTGMYSLSNQYLPSTSTPNNLMAVYWDDMRGYSGDHLWSYVSGSSPNRQWVISYDPWHNYGASSYSVQFQAIIYENDGSFENMIMFQYEDTTAYHDDHGASATAGIENSGGTEGHSYCYNGGNLVEGLNVVYIGVDGLYPNPFDLFSPADGSTFNVPTKGDTGSATMTRSGNLTTSKVSTTGTKGDIDITFEWDNNGMVVWEAPWSLVEFELLIDDDPAFGSPEYDIPGITGEFPSYMQTISVTEDTTFYWRVIATFIGFDDDYSTTCNDDFHFFLDVSPYVTIQPTSLGHIKAIFE